MQKFKIDSKNKDNGHKINFDQKLQWIYFSFLKLAETPLISDEIKINGKISFQWWGNIVRK